MSKFYEAILKDVSCVGDMRYIEQIKLLYKEEDITDLVSSKITLQKLLLSKDIKGIQDEAKRALRKYSKFRRRPKSVKLCVLLNDNTYLVSNTLFNDRFDKIQDRYEDFQCIKEHMATKEIEIASLGSNYSVDEVKTELEFRDISIVGVKYI